MGGRCKGAGPRREGLPLLLSLQRIIEQTFDLDTGIPDISPFIIGDDGYGRLYGGRVVAQSVGGARRRPGHGPDGAAGPASRGPEPAREGRTARTLCRAHEGSLRVGLYYPDRLVENLELHDPGRTISDRNVDDFGTLVEELDHFLTIADRHRAGAEVSLLELELHANVTKELMVRLFIARMRGSGGLTEEDRAWVRHHLFHKLEYSEKDPEVNERYREAASLAVRYLDHLYGMPAASRPVELRRFHRRSHHAKLAQIAGL